MPSGGLDSRNSKFNPRIKSGAGSYAWVRNGDLNFFESEEQPHVKEVNGRFPRGERVRAAVGVPFGYGLMHDVKKRPPLPATVPSVARLHGQRWKITVYEQMMNMSRVGAAGGLNVAEGGDTR